MAGLEKIKYLLLFVLFSYSLNLSAKNTPLSYEDCASSVNRMFSAQATRGGKAYRACILRGASENCLPLVTEPDEAGNSHLTALDPKLAREFKRIERHAEGKFPYRCNGEYVQDFFKPLCLKANTETSFNSKEDLTECLYIEYVMPWLVSMHNILMAHPEINKACQAEMLGHLRLAYRDQIRWGEDDYALRKNRLRICRSSNVDDIWSELVQITKDAAQPLRDIGSN